MAKQLQKNYDLWSTQKYSKVSKICSACVGIFFRVTHMFKPTVSTLIFLGCGVAQCSKFDANNNPSAQFNDYLFVRAMYAKLAQSMEAMFVMESKYIFIVTYHKY